jgi:glucose/arabinose dehydrogenase
MRIASILALLPLAAVLAAPSARAQGLLPTGFSDQPVVSGLDFPVAMARLPDGRVFVIEQLSAKVRLIVNGALSGTDPVCTIDQVVAGGEQGLLGIAVDPGWPARPYIYVHCDASVPGHTIRISRYTVTGDLSFAGNGALSIDVASRRDLINDLPDAASNHNGGTLRFGLDGRLYDSVGEDAQACLAQDDSTCHGVILRLDVSRLPTTPGGPPTLDVITPGDNPQIGASNLKRRLIEAWGLRNPFRFQIDPSTGARFIGDVGQSAFEEIDLDTGSGRDFGWPYFEGPAILDASCDTSGTLSAPIAWYDRTNLGGSAAVIMGPVYPIAVQALAPGDTAFPIGYGGDAFFSDYYHGFLRRLHRTGSSWALATPEPGQPSPTDWGQGFEGVSDYLFVPDGSIWYCQQGAAGGAGEIRRIVYTGSSSVGGQPATPVLTVGSPFPQPSSGAVTLQYSLGITTPVKATIHDVRGRLIRRLESGVTHGPGDHLLAWDGLDDRGHGVETGFYLVRIEAGGLSQSRRIVLVR